MRRLSSATLFAAAAVEIYRKKVLRSAPICDLSHRSLSAAAGFGMRRLSSATLFAGGEIHRKLYLRSAPVSHRSLSAAAGFGMRRLNSAALFAGGAEIHRKLHLRSAPISHRSLSSAGGFGMSRKPYLREKKLPFPAELSASGNVAELSCDSAASGGVCHVYLLGTEHYAKKSYEEVKALIEFVKPEAVFVELCPSRAHFLKDENPELGGEFHVAYNEAIKHSVKKVRLGDRPIHITRARFRIMAYFWERLVSPLKVMYLTIKKVAEIDDDHFLHLSHDEMRRILYDEAKRIVRDEKERLFPSYCETIVFERDRYMSATLLEVAQQHNSVVAVVGKGHLPGMLKYWKQPVDMKQLLHAPTRTRMVARIRHVVLNRISIFRERVVNQ